jgi:hypothetical protein
VRCGRGADAKGRFLRPAGKGSEGSFVLLSLITHHGDPEILRIGSPSPVPATEERCTASSTGAAACRTSHLAPRICTQSVQPRVLPRHKKTRAAARTRRHLAPLAPEQRSTAQHSVACRRGGQFSQVANARSPSGECALLHQATRRPRTTDEGGTLPWPFWKAWLEAERRGKEEGRKAAPSTSARVLVISLFLSPR